VKRQGKNGARRARRPPRGSKRAARNGVVLGEGIARLLLDVYKQRRGPTPAWVTQLVTHYTGTARKS